MSILDEFTLDSCYYFGMTATSVDMGEKTTDNGSANFLLLQLHRLVPELPLAEGRGVCSFHVNTVITSQPKIGWEVMDADGSVVWVLSYIQSDAQL